MSEQKKIAEWLKVAGKESPENPKFPDSKNFKLALNLILEELFEAAESGPDNDALEFIDDVIANTKKLLSKIKERKIRKEGDLIELRDACADLRVVMGNLIHFAGINEKYEEDFSAVMKSNFTKFCTSEQQAIETVEAYANGTHPNKQGEKIDSYYEKIGDYWVIKKKEGNKILKSIGFVEAEIK